ncbi:MAG TPA: MFS transporter [Anaerolineaceae bacterium]|nr:MFS transporter [Anaerolineaceae bacterium]HOE03266.1 MFS transporter [Anaerolineaceae bacterium]
MKRVNGWYLFVLNAYWIGLSFMWNSLHVTILPAVLLKYVPDTQKNTWLGLLTFFGLIIAMLVQPVSGAVSDHWRSKLGRRRPLMWFGTAGDLFFLLLMGFIGGLPALFIGYIGLQTTSNIAHGPAQGLLPDEVPAEKLGLASGIKTALDMAGIVLSSLLMGFLISSSDPNPRLAVTVIIALLVVFGLITLVFTKESPSIGEGRNHLQLGRVIKETFNFKVVGDKHYWQLILSRFLYLVGIYGFQSFAQYFIRDKFPEQDPIMFTQFVMGTFVVVLIIFSLLAGTLSDRYGRKKLQILSSIIGGIGAILLIFAKTPAQLLIYGGFMGVGLGIFLSVNWAIANDMVPKDNAAKYMGLTNIATAGSAAIARLEGPMTDALNNAAPGQWWGWTALFAVSALLMLLSAGALLRVPETRKA